MTPVVLLTGFLGSGKTTLLNRLLALRQGGLPSGGKLAILVNELGDVGVNASLLPPGAARQVELPGGCICCTLDENLETSLGELIDAEPAIELVIIETTGIAEPLPILWTLTGEALAARVRVAAVVTVVDSLEHERHRPLAPAVDNQVEHADVVVVSKLDVEADGAAGRLGAIERAVHQRSPSAAVIAEPSAAAGAAALWRLLADPALERRSPGPLRPVHGGHAHAHPFEVISAEISGPLDLEELSAELEALPAGWVRIKGICWARDRSSGSDQLRLVAFHRVGARVSAEPIEPVPSPPPVARVVALGTGLALERLLSCVDRAVIPSVKS